ncbi:Protein O-glucosyltransferase 1 [Tetrabaena socialis]|uniref:Protein O-glucosyltransferase 1 n=1 Tax=Tetrabaena socialis TaxID=47790 RepID=A0A2J8ACR8_9CHLO|nr:Protein O-glucosyltransferase 1 [Tetrabaena socialis]|eukprot:PNH10315.1 Protein O-glucosyltransferase 1 [Tetrabaena socialis]
MGRQLPKSQFNWNPSSVYLYPWHLKKDLAYFRGVPFCSGYWHQHTAANCTFICPRAYLSWRSFDDQRSGRPQLLDVGLVEPFVMPQQPGPGSPPLCVPEAPPVVPRTPVADHTHYKWLLHIEGVTASSRLSQLFMTNSVVLFQQQPFVEYFYRSLKPNVHYVPFWMATPAGIADVYDVVERLRRLDRDEPAATQRIVREAQMFATKFTSPSARAHYLLEALMAYKALFADMDAFLEGYVAGLREKGFDIK